VFVYSSALGSLKPIIFSISFIDKGFGIGEPTFGVLILSNIFVST